MIRSGTLFFGLLLFVSGWLIPEVLKAQSTDSLRRLSHQEFLSVVRTYHPVVRQAGLLPELAAAELISARGGFDPLFTMSGEKKTLDGKNYYDWVHPELKIPLWFGVDIKAGLESNLGDLLNPETTPGRSSYLGITVPVARNLIMDKRRAVLKQAKLFTELSRAEQLQIINDFLVDANYAYWNWARDYEIYRIRNEAVVVTETRYNLVKLGFRQGDRPAIDTTEALAQLESFMLSRNEAWVSFVQSGLELSDYLWTGENTPYYLTPDIVPDSMWQIMDLTRLELPQLEELRNQAALNHPKLRQFDFKIRMLEIERQLKFQELLPVINLKGNLLNKGYNVFKDASPAFYENNYKFGFDVGVPLRFSQGRGQYRAAKIKLRDAGLGLQQTRLEIDNKIKAVFTEAGNLQTQIDIARRNYENYFRLFRGEETRFTIGESSLFLLNSRENKVLESRQKLAELQAKFMQAIIALQGAAGQMR